MDSGRSGPRTFRPELVDALEASLGGLERLVDCPLHGVEARLRELLDRCDLGVKVLAQRYAAALLAQPSSRLCISRSAAKNFARSALLFGRYFAHQAGETSGLSAAATSRRIPGIASARLAGQAVAKNLRCG
jgi:hypothetical protein